MLDLYTTKAGLLKHILDELVLKIIHQARQTRNKPNITKKKPLFKELNTEQQVKYQIKYQTNH